MNPVAMLEAALAAARAAGAAVAEAYLRQAQSRTVIFEGETVAADLMRREMGLAVRVWVRERGKWQAGFAAMTPQGGDAAALGELAVAAARRADAGTQRPPQAESGETSTSATGDGGPAILDPDIVRVTGPEARRRIGRLLGPVWEAGGKQRSSGVRSEIRLGVLDAMVARGDGWQRSERGTLAALTVRFPTAFGLGRIEIASRRLHEIEQFKLAREMALQPPTGVEVVSLIAAPAKDEGQPCAVFLSPPCAAPLLMDVARRAWRAGRHVTWSSPGRLMDDPGIAWGPGSALYDGDGNQARRRLVAGPAADDAGTDDPPLPSTRLSWREPPRPAPTNLILEGLPGAADPGTAQAGANRGAAGAPREESADAPVESMGAPAGGRRQVCLLRMVARDGADVLAQGILMEDTRQAVPCLLRLRLDPLDPLAGGTNAGGAWPSVPGFGYARLPWIALGSFALRPLTA